MSNSPLVSYTKLSPNHSGKRKHTIDTISIHCMAGNLSVERCGELFQNKERQASSNYGIGSDGRIGLYVDEANRSWCTSSASNDNRAVTIEVANTVAKDPWPVSDAAYKSLIDLLVDICQRNGIPKLLWKGDKNLVGQVDRQNMTVHRWFAAKACPGDWLYSRHGQIAAEVNKRLEAAKAGKDGSYGHQTAHELRRHRGQPLRLGQGGYRLLQAQGHLRRRRRGQLWMAEAHHPRGHGPDHLQSAGGRRDAGQAAGREVRYSHFLYQNDKGCKSLLQR